MQHDVWTRLGESRRNGASLSAYTSSCQGKKIKNHRAKQPSGFPSLSFFLSFIFLQRWRYGTEKVDGVFLTKALDVKLFFLSLFCFFFNFGGVPVSNLLNVQEENVCKEKDEIKHSFRGESVTCPENCCACHVQSHLCIPHTCKTSIYCARSLGSWRWEHLSDLRYKVSVHYSVTSKALYLQNPLKLLIWMCVKDDIFTSCTAWPCHYPHILHFIHQQIHMILLLFSVYIFLIALIVSICLQRKCGACYTAPLLDF